MGFFFMLHTILRMRRGGLISAGPPCGPHVFMCSSKTKKSKWNPRGDLSSETCIRGNCVATRTVLGLLLGVARGVHFLLEQPSSSVMVYLPVMEHLMNSMTRLGLAQPAAVRLLLASICTCTVRVWAAAGACTCVRILNLNVPVSWMGLLGAKSMKRTVLVATVPHACE